MERCDSCNCGTNSARPGTLYVIGTGPGGLDHLTPAVGNALATCTTVIGYSTYLDLIPGLLVGKEVISSAMMQEVDRGRKALELAESGQNVALVSGGDPGIYAMAGLVFELAVARDSQATIEIIPGIAAVNACAARLGAPLMHDFAAISLSDLLTPWPVIEKRLAAAAEADFVIAIYNPKSKKRAGHIGRAREIIMAHRAPTTPVGIVTAATREQEQITITTLENLLSAEIGMQSCVIVGNSTTFHWRDFMITPRGYHRKYEI